MAGWPAGRHGSSNALPVSVKDKAYGTSNHPILCTVSGHKVEKLKRNVAKHAGKIKKSERHIASSHNFVSSSVLFREAVVFQPSHVGAVPLDSPNFGTLTVAGRIHLIDLSRKCCNYFKVEIPWLTIYCAIQYHA